MKQSHPRRFAVRPRTLLILMLAIIVIAAAAVWYFVSSSSHPGRIELRDLSVEATQTVGLAGAFPAEGDPVLRNPLGIAWNGRELFVAESDAGEVRIFDAEGGRAGTIMLPPAKGASAVYPSSIAAVERDRVAIVDNAAQRVIVVPARPADPAEIDLTLNGPGGSAMQPTAVTYADGEYFVFDATAAAVLVFNTAGELTRTIADDLKPKLTFAGGMCVVDGQLYITDSNAGRVVAVDATTGEQTLVLADRFGLPRGVVGVGDGTIAVVDAFDRAAYLASATGERIDVIDAATVPDAPMDSPRSAAWLPDSARLYVTDAAQGRVLVFNVRTSAE